MRKLKGAGVVLGIMLFAAAAWAALITFLIKTFWVGVALSLAGGVAIGIGLIFLIRRWWFREMSEMLKEKKDD